MGLYSSNAIYALTEEKYMAEVLHKTKTEDFSNAISLIEACTFIHEAETDTFNEMINRDFISVMEENDETKTDEEKKEAAKKSEAGTSKSLWQKIKDFLKRILDIIKSAFNKFINKIIELFASDKKLVEKYYGPIKKANLEKLPTVKGGKLINGNVNSLVDDANNKFKDLKNKALDFDNIKKDNLDSYKKDLDTLLSTFMEAKSKAQNEGNIDEKLNAQGVENLTNLMNKGAKSILEDLSKENKELSDGLEACAKLAEKESIKASEAEAEDANAKYTGISYACTIINKGINAIFDFNKFKITTFRRAFIIIGRSASGQSSETEQDKKDEEIAKQAEAQEKEENKNNEAVNNNETKKTKEKSTNIDKEKIKKEVGKKTPGKKIDVNDEKVKKAIARHKKKQATKEAVDFILGLTSDFYVTEALEM